MDTQNGSKSAAEQLRDALGDWRVRRGLSVDNLVARSGLSRTTVSRALNQFDPIPSAETVTALAKALGLDQLEREALLALRRAAVDAAKPHVQQVTDEPGVPIDQCDPLDLEVHPANSGTGLDAAEKLPHYVRRAHDGQLARVVDRAAGGRSAMAMLVGWSSTGKTRACWEAIQPLAASGWRLWHPFDPTRADAALAQLGRIGPRTVVWLIEAQHYLDVGERLSAALHALITDAQRAPVLVLGTLWPDYDDAYARRPRPGTPDPHARTRALLAGRRITVPDEFDDDALREARRLAESGDRALARALARAHGGRIAQHLAGAPELLRRYNGASPQAKALLSAAVDARRMGVGLHLPLEFLAGAAPGYLDDEQFDTLSEDWLERALAQLAEPVHGNLAPLRLVRGRPDYGPSGTASISAGNAPGPLYRLADYLDQHGRHERRALCPPASFWHASHTHLTDASDLFCLGEAAHSRYRLRWADAFYRRAADAGHNEALIEHARLREEAGDRQEAERLAQRAADAGDADALVDLAHLREEAGDVDGAEELYRRAAAAGDASALVWLADLRNEAGDVDGAETLYRQAADTGDPDALVWLALRRTGAGDLDGAEELYRRAADAGESMVLIELAVLRERAGDRQEAERLAQGAADAGHEMAWTQVALVRAEGGDPDGAEVLCRRGIDVGDTTALMGLAILRGRAGDRQEAERLALRAADAGHEIALAGLAVTREEAGDRQEAERLALRAADAGHTMALTQLALVRAEAGDLDSAEELYQRAADRGDTEALTDLTLLRAQAGDRKEAERLALRAADAGYPVALIELAFTWREDNLSEKASVLQYGLEPDGRPSDPWLPHLNDGLARYSRSQPMHRVTLSPTVRR